MLMGHRTTWSRAVLGIRRLGGVNRNMKEVDEIAANEERERRRRESANMRLKELSVARGNV
jgi:hypothetical protein